MPSRRPRTSARSRTAGGPELIWGPTFDRALAFAAELGLRPEAFYAALGRRPDRRRGARVPLDLLARFLTWAAEASGDVAFGLRLGAQFHPSDLGAYGYLLLNSPTLGDAMALAQRFVDFQQQGEAFVWKRVSDVHSEIRYDARGLEERLRRQDTECTLAIVHAVVQRLAARAVRPAEVRVQHSVQGSPLAEHFGCPVLYDDRDNALRYETSLLAVPIRGADPKLLAILSQYVEQELEGLPSPSDEMGRVRWAIRRGLGAGRVSVEVVARQCRVGARTLQRRLAARGLTFSGVVDQVRRDVRAELERSQQRSRREMAELLGFSDTSAFAKAERRWARRNPKQRSSTAP